MLTYTPVSDVDYGTLSCRSTNLAGQQSTPCIYTLLPATRPDPPTNCTVYNLTDDSLDLHCLAGNNRINNELVVYLSIIILSRILD